MENELARITTKLSDEKFNIFAFQRLKCIRYGEYMDIVAMKPRKEKSPTQKAKAARERKKRIKQRKIEKEEKMKEEKLKNADYEMWELIYGEKHEKEREKERKKEREMEKFFIRLFKNRWKEVLEEDKAAKKEWNKKVKAERAFGNLRSSANMLYKFIHANFYKRQGIHVTLTYSVPQYDDKEVYHDFKIFWQKLRYYYPNLGYISVLEPHQSGAWHIHLLLRDVTSNKIFVGYEDIRSFWNHGFCYVSNMKSNEDYGWYFKKKIKPDNPLLKYYKEGVRYFRYSRNMSKPDVSIINNASELDLQTLISKNYKKLNQFSLDLYIQKSCFDDDESKKKLTQIYYARYIVKEAWNKTIALRYKKKDYYELCEYRERLKLESKNESIDV